MNYSLFWNFTNNKRRGGNISSPSFYFFLLPFLIVGNLCLLNSCKNDFDLQKEYYTNLPPKFLVDAVIISGKPPIVKIYKMLPFNQENFQSFHNSTDIPYILYGFNNAIVEIKEEGGKSQVLGEGEDSTNIGYIFNNLQGKTGKTYHLTIEIDTLKLKTKAIIPDFHVKIRDFKYKISKITDEKDESYIFTGSYQYSSDSFPFYTLTSSYTKPSTFSNLMPYEDIDIKKILPNQEKIFTQSIFSNTDKVSIEKQIISEKSYDFFTSVSKNLEAKTNLYAIPANINSTFSHPNFIGAFLGINLMDTSLNIINNINARPIFKIYLYNNDDNLFQKDSLNKSTVYLAMKLWNNEIIFRDTLTFFQNNPLIIPGDIIEQNYNTKIGTEEIPVLLIAKSRIGENNREFYFGSKEIIVKDTTLQKIHFRP